MSNLDELLDNRYSSDSDEIREDYGDAEERAVLIRKAAASFVSSAWFVCDKVGLGFLHWVHDLFKHSHDLNFMFLFRRQLWRQEERWRWWSGWVWFWRRDGLHGRWCQGRQLVWSIEWEGTSSVANTVLRMDELPLWARQILQWKALKERQQANRGACVLHTGSHVQQNDHIGPNGPHTNNRF